MDRKQRIEAERERVSASNAAETAALGTAAGSLILGALLARSDAAHATDAVHAPQPAHVETSAHETSAAANATAFEAPVAAAPDSGEAQPISPSSTDHSAMTQPHPSPADGQPQTSPDVFAESSDTTVIGGEAGNAAIDPATSGAEPAQPAGSPAINHGSHATIDAAPTSILHAAEQTATAIDTTLSSLTQTISSVTQSITATLTHSVDHIANLASDIAASVTAPFSGANSPVDALLHDAVAAPLDSALDALPLSGTGPTASAVEPLLPSATGNSGSPFDHPSASAFEDLASSLQISVAGQPLAHVVGIHDLGAHDAGSSILHGFV